jgi:hypothetical protein
MIEKVGFYCERKERCNWKCFALDKGGAAMWSDDPHKTDAWLQAHNRECGGRFFPVYINTDDAPLEGRGA